MNTGDMSWEVYPLRFFQIDTTFLIESEANSENIDANVWWLRTELHERLSPDVSKDGAGK